MMLRVPVPAIVGAMLLATGAPAAGQKIDSLALRDDARALAADSMLGRGTGTAGERAAAAYIARRLEGLGLEPVAGNEFPVPVPLLRVSLQPDSRIEVRTPRDTALFRAGVHFVMPTGGRGALHGFSGPVVYLPDGVPVDPAALRGSVVLTTQPPSEATAERIRAWIAAGVAGMVLPLAGADAFAAAQQRAALRLIVDAAVDDPIWQPDLPIVHAGPELVQALIRNSAPPATPGPLPLGRTLDADLRFHLEPVPAANLAAIVTGADPALRDEVVLLTAHYDHLGVGPAVDGDSIYNGFSDNAAGVAMLLGIAGALRADPPPRSVAFLFTTGEERGLLGSTAWAANPPIPLSRVAAVLNLDAGAPPAPPVRWRVAGDTTLAAVRLAARVVAYSGWTADLTGANANSDHWPFLARGVPALFLVPGREWEGMDDAARDRLFETWDRYHQPGDEWRPSFPLSGLHRYARLALDIVRALASP